MILFNSTVTKIQIISYQKNEMKKYSKNKIKMSKREDIHFYKYKKKHHTNGGVLVSKLFRIDSVFFVEAFDTSVSLSEFLTSCIEWVTV